MAVSPTSTTTTSLSAIDNNVDSSRAVAKKVRAEPFLCQTHCLGIVNLISKIRC